MSAQQYDSKTCMLLLLLLLLLLHPSRAIPCISCRIQFGYHFLSWPDINISGVTGACPVTTTLIIRVNVRTTTAPVSDTVIVIFGRQYFPLDSQKGFRSCITRAQDSDASPTSTRSIQVRMKTGKYIGSVRMELRACGTAIITPNTRLESFVSPMPIDPRIQNIHLIDPGMLIYHPLPNVSGVSQSFQALFISSLYLLSDRNGDKAGALLHALPPCVRQIKYTTSVRSKISSKKLILARYM